MIAISKDESLKLREQYPDIYIVRTAKQKSKRHRYLCPPEEHYMRLIADTNIEAADIIKEIDIRKAIRQKYSKNNKVRGK